VTAMLLFLRHGLRKYQSIGRFCIAVRLRRSSLQSTAAYSFKGLSQLSNYRPNWERFALERKTANRREASMLGGFGIKGEIEMRKIIGVAAFVAMVFTAIPASAQPNDPYDYPYCLQGHDYGLPGLCRFRSYLECEATASGTLGYCGINPRFAFAYGWQPRGRRLY